MSISSTLLLGRTLHHSSHSLPNLSPKRRTPLQLPTRFISIPSYYSWKSKSRKFPKALSLQSSTESSSGALLSHYPSKLQSLITLFNSVEEPKAKYQQLLFYGKKLAPLRDEFKTPENKVRGCVSQVWVRAYMDGDEKNVFFEADSDSVLTKGLAALLVEAFSGSPPEEIVKTSPEFIQLLGLNQSLTPSRSNGFFNMLKLMQRKALELYMGKTSSEDDDENHSNSAEKSLGFSSASSGRENAAQNPMEEAGDLIENGGKGGAEGLLGRADRIREKLVKGLRPVELEVEDVSHAHAGHAGSRDDGETHFNLKVVSEEFEGKSLIKRHRIVYDLLQEELQGGLHALSIIAKTPDEVRIADR